MSQGSVNDGIHHVCGTTHCFGGWYAVAALDNELDMTYHHGVYKLQDDLGFTGSENLHNWAKRHPKLWGNMSGQFVFERRYAFFHPDKRPHGALTLQHIVDHLEEVRDRLPLYVTPGAPLCNY